MVIPMMCLTMLLTAPVAADSRPPTTRPAPLAGSAELQAEWNRYFPADAQQALTAVVDGDRTDIEHRAFFVLWDAAGKLTDAQLRAAPEVTDIEDLIAHPEKYRGRLVSFYVAVRHVRRPEDRMHRGTSETVLIRAADCTVKKGYFLQLWSHEPGGRVTPNEGLLVRGFFYKTFRYRPQGSSRDDEPVVGLGMVSRYLKKKTAAADLSVGATGWGVPTSVMYVLGALFVLFLAMAVVAFVLNRRSRKTAAKANRTE